MKASKSFFASNALKIIMLAAFAFPLVGMGAIRALRGNRNDVKEWLPASFAETREYQEFQKNFPHETFVLASWQGCTLDDPRLEQFAEKILKPLPTDKPGTPVCFEKVITGVTAIDELTKAANVPYDKAVERLRGSLVGPIGKAAAFAATVNPTTDIWKTPPHAWQSGQSVKIASSKVLPTSQPALEPDHEYYVHAISDTAISIHRTPSEAVSGNNPIDFINTGIGRHSISTGTQTCAVMTVSAAGKEALRATVNKVIDTAAACGIPRDQLHVGGPPVDNVAIDIEGERLVLRLMCLSGIIGLTLSYLCLRNIWLTLMVFFGGVYSAAFSLAIIKVTGFFNGMTMNSILMTMPSVVYVTGLSCAIHVVNYYRHARAEQGLPGAAGRGLRQAWVPCLLSAGTTSLGLISLYTSDLTPIRTFGLFTAIGVMSAIGLIYLFLPAALELWPPQSPATDDGEADENISSPHTNIHSGHSPLDAGHRRRMRWVGRKVIARPTLVWAIFILILLGSSAGLMHARTTVDLMSLFSPKSEIIQSYAWLEDHLGALVPMEVVIRMDNRYVDPAAQLQAEKNQAEKARSDQTQNGELAAAQTAPANEVTAVEPPIDFLSRMELVSKIQKNIETIPEVGSTMSLVTFAPDIAQPAKGPSFIRRTRRQVTNKHLYEARSRFLESDYLAEDPDSGEELWRIQVRVAALKQVDYGEFIQQIKAKVEPLLNTHVDAATQAARGYRLAGVNGAIYTGLTPVVYKAESALLRGLIESFFVAFAMMAVIMTLVFRDIRAGLYTMLPNAWPVAVVFGLMSWLGIVLDIGTMMTAGVAMGVCVDDTVHFANWFRRATRMGLPRREAVVMAYENSAGAIYQSTVIVALGLASFGLSNFMPTQRFGILMGTLLTFGLIADLVLTPAMLSGAIGRFFLRGCELKFEPGQPNPIDQLLAAGLRIDQPAKVIGGPTTTSTTVSPSRANH